MSDVGFFAGLYYTLFKLADWARNGYRRSAGLVFNHYESQNRYGPDRPVPNCLKKYSTPVTTSGQESLVTVPHGLETFRGSS